MFGASPGRDTNPCTRISHDWQPQPSLRDAFTRVATRLHAPERPGYQVFAVGGPRLTSLHLPPLRSAFAVVGRHTACDISLDDDPAVSLRHLLLRVVTLRSGALALRVIDLATRSGFQTHDGITHVAVVAEGPFAFRLGRSAIFAIPWGVEVEAVLPPASPSLSGPVPHMLPAHPYREAGRAPWRSRVSVVPPPSSFVCTSGGERGERVLTVRHGDARVEVRRSLASLSSGVLLGRYPRCDTDARSLMGHQISRVHALLLHEAGQDLVFDLASTNGLWWHGVRVREVALRDGDRVRLAARGSDSVSLRWRHEPPCCD